MHFETDPVVAVRGLRRRYGSGSREFEAVRGVDLEVAAGTVTALLGTNGAGKTSTLEVIEGLAAASDGTVRVFGRDPVADRAHVRRRTGVLLQESGFPGDLTVAETMRMWAATLSDPMPTDDTLTMVDLADRSQTRVRALSGGETRRLDLACALMGDPELVLLDEPTTGLDPESRRNAWELIAGLRERGVAVLLCTHYLEEAETLADRVAIMHAGRIVRSGTPAEIVADHPSSVSFETPSTASATLTDLPGTTTVQRNGRTVLMTYDLQRSLHQLLNRADEERLRLDGLRATSASLEAVFLDIASGTDHDRSNDLETTRSDR